MNIFPYKREINKKHDYCCYLTIYSGNLLPPFYLGSSTVDKINNGYHGSVRSKKWQVIYEKELQNNPHLFNTSILKTTATRKMSLAIELFLQKKNGVVKSNFFFNESLAQKDGMFGRDVSGKNNPMHGKSHPSKGKKLENVDYSGENNSMFGKTNSKGPQKAWNDMSTVNRLNHKKNVSNNTKLGMMKRYFIIPEIGPYAILKYKPDVEQYCLKHDLDFKQFLLARNHTEKEVIDKKTKIKYHIIRK